MYKLTREEMETTINFDRSSDTANIYTTDPVMMRKMDKLAQETTVITMAKQDAYCREYECPKALIKVSKPRVISEEQRQELAERMRADKTISTHRAEAAQISAVFCYTRRGISQSEILLFNPSQFPAEQKGPVLIRPVLSGAYATKRASSKVRKPAVFNSAHILAAWRINIDCW